MTLPREDSSTPEYVRPLGSGVEPASEPVTLDPATVKDLARQVREIEEARAAAAISAQNYLIR
jgi:hypothetical protein